MNSLDANIRNTKTKGELNSLRDNGNVPAIIYGGKDETNLEENPLLDPPGMKDPAGKQSKFGQDRGEKLSFAKMDAAEFFSAIGNALKQGKLVDQENKPVLVYFLGLLTFLALMHFQ